MKAFNKLDIQLFLDLCYPRRSKVSQEYTRNVVLSFSPLGSVRYIDAYGNLFVTIGGNERVAFTSHLDNVDNGSRGRLSYLPVVVEGFAGVDPRSASTCLGADDAAGLYIMMTMMQNKASGTYCFFMDEEIGCVGSQYAAKNMPPCLQNCELMVSFDRYGYDSVITHQMGDNTCSMETAVALCEKLNKCPSNLDNKFKPDDGGSYTDSYSFYGIIPNCTNVSVGYFGQHTRKEQQDLNFLVDIAKVYSSIDWTDLPVGELMDNASYLPDGYMDYDYNSYEDTELLDVLEGIQELVYNNPDCYERVREDLLMLLEKHDVSSPFYVGQ